MPYDHTKDLDLFWVTAEFRIGDGPMPDFEPDFVWPPGIMASQAVPFEELERVTQWEILFVSPDRANEDGSAQLVWRAGFRRVSKLARLAEAGTKPPAELLQEAIRQNNRLEIQVESLKATLARERDDLHGQIKELKAALRVAGKEAGWDTASDS